MTTEPDPQMPEPLAAEIRDALARVERGEVVDLGSFAQYADDADSVAVREDLMAAARARTERERRKLRNRLVHWLHLQRHRESHRQSCTCRGGRP